VFHILLFILQFFFFLHKVNYHHWSQFFLQLMKSRKIKFFHVLQQCWKFMSAYTVNWFIYIFSFWAQWVQMQQFHGFSTWGKINLTFVKPVLYEEIWLWYLSIPTLWGDRLLPLSLTTTYCSYDDFWYLTILPYICTST
jgi:hypothetical protein